MVAIARNTVDGCPSFVSNAHMQKSDLTLGKLIDRAAEMERMAYDFYAALEEQFKSNGEFVACLNGIKEDELLHLRVLTEIKRSLSDVRLLSPVTEEAMKRLVNVLDFLEKTDVTALKTTDEICDAITKLEEVEFDVVMGFVGLEEINFEFTKEYLRNESLEHGNKVFQAQQCLL